MTGGIWETCLLLEGVKRSDCAGWWQAWGSILGLAIAIGVPLWLRRDERKELRGVRRATAEVTSADVLMGALKSIGMIDALEFRWQEHRSTSDLFDVARDLHSILSDFSFPQEAQLLAMAHVWPGPVSAIAQANSHIQIATDAMKAAVQTGLGGREVSAHDVQTPMNMLGLARAQLVGAYEGIRPDSPPVPIFKGPHPNTPTPKPPR